MKYAAALDQGTTSTRAMVFDHAGRVVSIAQHEHRKIYPKPGWVEHDPIEIVRRSRQVLNEVLDHAGIEAGELCGLGIANQRETTVVWDRQTGEPIHNAIVWQDTRTAQLVATLGAASDLGPDRFRESTGLPLAPYFSGPKASWILDHVAGARERALAGELAFGTVDSWLIWNLTGGIDGGLHMTDVTNASRTLLLDLGTLAWNAEIAEAIGVPMAMLPQVRSSSEVYGEVRGGGFDGVPIAGDLGDQQAATFGQTCFAPGEAKNTYGTGNFLLLNVGNEPVRSRSGLLTTVGYKLGDDAPTYCLEGSVAITGGLIQWLRDNLGLIEQSVEIEALAASVDDNGGVYLVPAFAGLFAPYWRADARGVLVGLTQYVTKAHIARAALEATAFQSRELVEAISTDAGITLETLKVDGGMVANQLLMQFQADILDLPVIRPQVAETTALGAAYAAGLATGFWDNLDDLRENWVEGGRWEPRMDAPAREELFRTWKKAVTRTFDWLD